MTVTTRYVTKPEIGPAKQTYEKAVTGSLDRMDVHLLRELLQGSATLPLNPNFRRSYRSIAKILGVDENTARGRARRLEQGGFIQGWSIMVNPNLLGLHQSEVHFDVPSSVSKGNLILKLKLVPDVFLILNSYGSQIGLIFAYDSPFALKNTIDLIRSLSNTSNINRADVLFPECKIRMSVTDWRILRSLQRNLRRSYSSIAGKIGTSTRTVRRRLQRMVENKVLFAIASLCPKALHGTVLASLLIGHTTQNTFTVVRKISQELDNYLWHVFSTTPVERSGISNTWFSLALPSIAKAREILDWVERQNDVKDARIELWEDHIVLLQKIDHWLEMRLTALGIN